MKTAIVHDWVSEIGGAEKCLKEFCSLYPEARLYTLFFKEESLRQLGISPNRAEQSFISRLPFAAKHYRYYLPLFPLAIEQFDLTGRDLVLSSSHAAAKGVLTTPDQLHVCYCYTSPRYAWDLYHPYLRQTNLTRGLRSAFARVVLHYLRLWDQLAGARVDHYIAISHYIAKRIRKTYGKPAAVIYPPVDVDRFELNDGTRGNFYLTASRMVPYKQTILIVEAFNRMPDKKLVVIGNGPDLKQVRAKAGPNIRILGYQPLEILKDHLQRAKAFVFAAEEDFGILPVEAQACGTPVIAFGKGGVLETVIPGTTGMFFHEQSAEAMIQAVEAFERDAGNFDPHRIREHAEQFSKNRFRKEIRQFMEEKLNRKAEQ